MIQAKKSYLVVARTEQLNSASGIEEIEWNLKESKMFHLQKLQSINAKSMDLEKCNYLLLNKNSCARA